MWWSRLLIHTPLKRPILIPHPLENLLEQLFHELIIRILIEFQLSHIVKILLKLLGVSVAQFEGEGGEFDLHDLLLFGFSFFDFYALPREGAS